MNRGKLYKEVVSPLYMVSAKPLLKYFDSFGAYPLKKQAGKMERILKISTT